MFRAIPKLAEANQRQGQVRERRKIARRADTSTAWHYRHQAESIEIEQTLKRRQRDAGEAKTQRVNLEPQHEPANFNRHRIANADRVT